MRKLILLIAVTVLLSAGCTKEIDSMTVGEVKDKAIEQSKAVLESIKTLTAAVSEEEFKSEGNILEIVAKRGLDLANVNYDIASGSLSYSVNGTHYNYIKGQNGEKSEYVIDMLDDEKDIKAVETFLTDKAAGSNGFISSDAVTAIMTVVKDKAEDKTITFDGGESSVSRKDGRVRVSIRF